MTDVLIKRGDLDTEACGRIIIYVKMKTEMRVMFLQAIELQRLSAHHQKLVQSHGTHSSVGTNPANTLILDF